SPDADVVAPHDDISRRHALLHRERGQAFVTDLASANGTTVDGSRVGEDPVPIEQGSMLTLGSHRYRFVEIGDA
ncbi:MAG TPA: FHA domain-containing protein, partial [Acidimicrobiia bacterium]|nr:FHA domain-containing protein [Acidimicrobiia bacterium]